MEFEGRWLRLPPFLFVVGFYRSGLWGWHFSARLKPCPSKFNEFKQVDENVPPLYVGTAQLGMCHAFGAESSGWNVSAFGWSSSLRCVLGLGAELLGRYGFDFRLSVGC